MHVFLCQQLPACLPAVRRSEAPPVPLDGTPPGEQRHTHSRELLQQGPFTMRVIFLASSPASIIVAVSLPSSIFFGCLVGADSVLQRALLCAITLFTVPWAALGNWRRLWCRITCCHCIMPRGPDCGMPNPPLPRFLHSLRVRHTP